MFWPVSGSWIRNRKDWKVNGKKKIIILFSVWYCSEKKGSEMENSFSLFDLKRNTVVKEIVR